MWIVLSFATMSLMATMLLLFVAIGRAGVVPSVALFYILALALLFNFVYLKAMGTPLAVPRNAIPLIVCAALASFLGNLSGMQAMNLAPNAGYAVAIESSKVVAVALLSIWLFAAQFSLLKGLGVVLCTVGTALICL